MATPQQEPNPDSLEPIRDLLTYLRTENISNREYLRDQADADRDLLTKTAKLVAVPLAVLIAVVGFLGFKSLSDLKSAIQNEAHSESKAEIARMQTETDAQIKSMQSDIRERLNQQFQSQNLRGIVMEAAKEHTQTTAKPLIQAEVGSQVKRRLDAEQGSIQRAITDQTQAAVKQMTPQIDRLVKENVDSKIQSQVEPVRKELAAVQRSGQIQGLINRMNADDAQAFDLLATMPILSLESDEQKLIASSLRSVFLMENQGMFVSRSFPQPMSDEQLVSFLNNTEPTTRQAALDTLVSKKNVKLLPQIVNTLQNDSSLAVRASAYRLFNTWTGQKFNVLDKPSLLQWWNQHQKEFTAQ